QAPVNVFFDQGDPANGVAPVATATPAGDGTVSTSFVVPDRDDGPGRYTLLACQICPPESGPQATARFTLKALSSAPSITLDLRWRVGPSLHRPGRDPAPPRPRPHRGPPCLPPADLPLEAAWLGAGGRGRRTNGVVPGTAVVLPAGRASVRRASSPRRLRGRG